MHSEQESQSITPAKALSPIEKARWERENSDWLDVSSDIAMLILQKLYDDNQTKKELAQKLKVSPQHITKVVSGRENLTLKTIVRLQKALGIQLITVPDDITALTESVPQKTEQFRDLESILFPEATKQKLRFTHKQDTHKVSTFSKSEKQRGTTSLLVSFFHTDKNHSSSQISNDKYLLFDNI